MSGVLDNLGRSKHSDTLYAQGAGASGLVPVSDGAGGYVWQNAASVRTTIGVGSYTVGTLAARPATPTTVRDQYFATDASTLYGAKMDLSGWSQLAPSVNDSFLLGAAGAF